MMNTPHDFRQAGLQYRLEQQSREIEAVLRRYTNPQTAVTDGEVTSAAIHYRVRLDTSLPHRACQAVLTQTLETPITAVPHGCTVTIPHRSHR